MRKPNTIPIILRVVGGTATGVTRVKARRAARGEVDEILAEMKASLARVAELQDELQQRLSGGRAHG